MTHSSGKADALRAAGATPVVADALDADAVRSAVLAAQPDAVVHQLTALQHIGSMRQFDKTFAVTNRLRTEGTDHLLAAAREAGARRFIAQSYAGWPFARSGDAVKDERAPLDPSPPKAQRESLAAIRRLEATVTGADGIEGVVLRYGSLYGPGTSLAPGGEHLELILKRGFPVVGRGDGVWSFTHVADAAAAAVAALDHGAPGIYNIVDDDPAAVREWVPALARIVGAEPPRHLPTWMGRVFAGSVGVSMMTRVRGASNAKARAALDWVPTYPSWRDGFAALMPRQASPSARAPR
jgi:nucleoside-diphosphate-sugar epimerase